MDNITIPQVLLISLIGILIVFTVLVILMAFIKLMSTIINSTSKDKKIKQGVADINTESVSVKSAKGSCGTVAMFDVPDKTAAMAMAIVADQMQVPLNELRFISIKEIGEN